MKLLFRQKKGGDLWRNDNSIDNLSSDEMMIEWRNDNSWSIITSDEIKRDWQNDIINNLLPPLYDFNINQCEITWQVCSINGWWCHVKKEAVASSQTCQDCCRKLERRVSFNIPTQQRTIAHGWRNITWFTHKNGVYYIIWNRLRWQATICVWGKCLHTIWYLRGGRKRNQMKLPWWWQRYVKCGWHDNAVWTCMHTENGCGNDFPLGNPVPHGWWTLKSSQDVIGAPGGTFRISPKTMTTHHRVFKIISVQIDEKK